MASATASAAGRVAKKSFSQRWLSDPSTYPIFGVIGFAGVVCGGFCIRQLFFHPDCNLSPAKRAQVVRQNTAEGRAFSEHSIKAMTKGGDPQIMSGLNNSMVKSRLD